jgi:hypothetical protein
MSSLITDTCFDEALQAVYRELEEAGEDDNIMFYPSECTIPQQPTLPVSCSNDVNVQQPLTTMSDHKKTNRKRRNNKSVKKLETNTATVESVTTANVNRSGWIMKTPQDLPNINWTDGNYQYTIMNPENCGDRLLKIQLFDSHGRPENSCELYLNKTRDKHIYDAVNKLLQEIKCSWLKKNEGLEKSVCPLPEWRRTVTGDNNGASGGVKRPRTA